MSCWANQCAFIALMTASRASPLDVSFAGLSFEIVHYGYDGLVMTPGLQQRIVRFVHPFAVGHFSQSMVLMPWAWGTIVLVLLS